MRARLLFARLGLASLLCAASVRADAGDALAEAAARLAVEAAIRLTFMLIQYSVEPTKGEEHAPELTDWIDPVTNSTSRMNAGCGVLIETTLTTTPARNFLNVVLENETSSALMVDFMRVRFSNGVERWLPGETLNVIAKGRAEGRVRFPSKDDFSGQSWLEVDVAVARDKGQLPCTTNIRHERAASVAEDPETHVEYSEVELWAGGGRRFVATGGPRTFGRDEGTVVELGVARFFSAHHGYSIDLMSDYASGTPMASQVHGLGFAFGYVGRVPLQSWLSLSFGPSLGVMGYERDDGPRHYDTWVLVFQQRLRLQARIVETSGGGALYLAPSLVYQLLADGELGGVGLRGSSASALLSLGFGL